MRIELIHLDEFGHYSDHSLGTLDPRLTVIHGPNEAGKTTLLAFIRHIFFGFPAGTTRENRYMVRDGGAHGGRLHVNTEDGGHYRIERQRGGAVAGTVTMTADGGATLDPSELPRLLGHASRSLFESIFAFDLDALSSFDAADDAEVGSRLYGAGLGVSRLAGLLRGITQARDDIFVPRGRNQPVAELLGQLDGLESDLRAVQDQATEFAQLSRDLSETTDSITDLGQHTGTQEARRTELEQLANGWDTWTELGDVRQQLVEVPLLDAFPEDAVSRLERIEERLQNAQAAVAETSLSLEQARERVHQAVPDQFLLDHAGSLLAIREQRGAFNNSVRDLPARNQDTRHEEALLQEDLLALGAGWTEQRLDTFDLSIARRDEVERWSTDIQGAEQTRHDRERDVELLRANLVDAEVQLERVKRQRTELQAISPPDDHLRRPTLQRLIAPAALLIAAIVVTVAGVVLDQELLIGLGAGLLIAGIAAVWFGLATRATSVQPAIRTFRVDDAQFEESTRSVEHLHSRIEAADSARADTAAQVDALATQWTAWLASSTLPETLTTPGARDFLTRIEEARRRLGTVRERRERCAAIERDITAYRALVTPIAEASGIALDDRSATIASAASEIAERYDAAHTANQQHAMAEETVKERELELARRDQQLGVIRQECDQLLAAGGTSDVEEFRRLAAQHMERQELEQHERELIRALKHILGPNADLDALDHTLAATSRPQIETEQAEVRQHLIEMNVERDEALKRGAELRTNLTRLHGDEEASRLRAERAALQDKLQVHAADWSRWSVARALLEQARRHYEQERQPAVIERASAFFADLTGGRYSRLYKPLDEQSFRVIEADSEAQKTPEQLSRGTREQLYLALRLAAIDEFGQRQERLPVLVDEILVNFDPVRARQAAIAFGRLAQDNQVIVFTCQTWVRDLFCEVVPDTTVIELGDPVAAGSS